MKLITKVICVLRSAIAKGRYSGTIYRPTHLAAFSPCGTTDSYRFGVNKEEILTAVNFRVIRLRMVSHNLPFASYCH